MNKVMIMGNIGQMKELKYTPSGSAVLNFTVATTKNWKKDGQKQTKTEWHNCVAWLKAAELIHKFFAKGRKILIEGELETRTWEKEGVKHYMTEIRVDNFHFCDKAEAAGARRGGDDMPPPDDDDYGDSPTPQKAAYTNEDVPF